MNLKQQIILTPALVLLLLSLLLGFLQYSYWDLSVKRQQARDLRTSFIALTEADMAMKRIHALMARFSAQTLPDVGRLEEMADLYSHLSSALGRIRKTSFLTDTDRKELSLTLKKLNPGAGFNPEHFRDAYSNLFPQLAEISERLQEKQASIRDIHNDDIVELVERTAFVSIIVVGGVILLGIFCSIVFIRRILRRIHALTSSAADIAAGNLVPPPAPKQINDELDQLALSINLMTDKLIRVVSTEKLLEGAEEERRRLAMDIHDQTLADLSGVLRDIQELRDGETLAENATRLEKDLVKAIANLREVMDNLHPQTLDILGLGAALQSYLERHLDKTELPEYHLYIGDEATRPVLPKLAQLTVYRIAVEAIHNVIKHAQASRYEVHLGKRGDALLLAIEDNGTGFNLESALLNGGRGLFNIRERARTIAATVNWSHSRFSSGTRFELLLPKTFTEGEIHVEC